MVEPRVQVLPRHLRDHAGEIVPGGRLELEALVELLQAFLEGLRPQLLLEHVEDHEALAVADRLRPEVAALAELAQREILGPAREVEVSGERVAPVVARGCFALGELVRVVGQVGGQTLAPVARLVVDEDPVPPPVVQDLVPVAGVHDEGQADDPIPEQGEARHPEPGLPPVLHHGELAEGIGRDEFPVLVEVAAGGVEVGLAEFLGRVLVGEGVDAHPVVLALAHGVGSRHEIDEFLRRFGFPHRDIDPVLGEVLRAPTLAHRVPAVGQLGAQPEVESSVAGPRHPEGLPGQEGAALVDQSVGRLEAACVGDLGRTQAVIDRAGVLDLQIECLGGPAPFGGLHPVLARALEGPEFGVVGLVVEVARLPPAQGLHDQSFVAQPHPLDLERVVEHEVQVAVAYPLEADTIGHRQARRSRDRAGPRGRGAGPEAARRTPAQRESGASEQRRASASGPPRRGTRRR